MRSLTLSWRSGRLKSSVFFILCIALLLAGRSTALSQGSAPGADSVAIVSPASGIASTVTPPTRLFPSDPRLTEEQAKQIAAADGGILMILAKHPELERHATFDSTTRRWDVSWTHPVNGRRFISITIDDQTGTVVSSDIQTESYLDILPLYSEAEATETARNLQKIKNELEDHPDASPSASLGADDVWTVSFYDGSNEIARVLIDDTTGGVKEVMVGPQVAWQMARGYSGAFGRIVNQPYVWLPLCLLFLAPFVDIRRPFRLLHLDLLVLLSFTVSHYFFNQGEIFTSVPLVYPPLAYLFIRLAWIAVRKAPQRSAPAFSGTTYFSLADTPGFSPSPLVEKSLPLLEDADTEAAGRIHMNFPPLVIFIVLFALIVFRITINIADSNVVDVGYSGVIGAHRILENQTPYGHMSSDDQNGDTYGPLNYLVYVPFEGLMRWSGTWDDLPAAHATAIFFDLLTIAGLFFAGRRLAGNRRAGNRLGLAFAYAWVAFPYTTFVLNCNVNDTIVAAILVWGIVFIRSALVSGLMLGLATQVKFFPAVLGPLWASFPHAFKGWGRRALFVLAFVAALAVVMPVVFLGDGTLHTFLDRSIFWQIGRDSPFSIWGQHPDRLATAQHVGQYVLIALAIVSYAFPVRKSRIQVAAASAAMIVGFQILLTHWFYLYIPWFFPLAMIALLVVSGREKAGKRARSIIAPSV